MVTIAEMQRRLNETDQQIDTLTEDSINETGKDYAELNTEQMWEGQRNDGNAITPSYAARTIAYKKRAKQPYDRVTLKDTGAFYSGFKVEAGADKITMQSDVDYEKYIQERYGDKIFGLDDERRKQYTFNSFWPQLKKKLVSILKLEFV